jgi:hypothetical protein
MKTFIYIVPFLLVSAFSWAQTEIAYDSVTDIHRYTYQAQLYDYRANSEQNSYRTVSIKGTAFLCNKMQTGTVPLQNNRSITLQLNYNILEDYLLVDIGKDQKQVFPESFTINDQTFIRINGQYFEALYVGKTKLLRKYLARLDKVERNGYNESIKYDYEYSKNQDLFLHLADGSLQPIRLREKSLLSKLHPTAKGIIQKENLDLRSEKDIIVLLSKLEQ